MNLNLTPLLTQAYKAFQSGQLDIAQGLAAKVLSIQSNNFDALYLSGVIHGIKGQHDIAAKQLKKAVALSPQHPFVHFNLAKALMEQGRDKEAMGHLQKSLRLEPNNSDAELNLGLCLLNLRNYNESLNHFNQALKLNPQSIEAMVNKATCLLELQMSEVALDVALMATQLNPQNDTCWAALGAIYFKLNNPPEAISSYQKAIELNSNNFKYHLNVGKCWTNFAKLFAEERHYLEALTSFNQALELNDNSSEAWGERGVTLNNLRRPEEALTSLMKALNLNLEAYDIFGAILSTQMQICDWIDLEQRCLTLEKRLLANQNVTYPFPVLGLFDNPQLQKLSAQLYAQDKLSAVSPLGPTPPRKPGGKIRLGYYSADFHNHATAYLMAELFESHDKNRFELYAFSFGPDYQDEMRQRVSKAFDHFIDVRAQSDRAVAVLSRELGIDIAIDLKGYTKGSRTQIFAHRAAPVQINYLGYPGTMGTDYMDYLIADPILIHPQSQEFFTEKIIYLPHTYQVNDAKRVIADKRWSRPDLGLPAEGFVFCCFNNNYKITPETFGIWMRLLQAVGGSVLWLLEDNPTAVKNLHKRAHAAGVEPDRLVFAKRSPLPEHLARHRLADLFLDTLPCNAHTTASDALWMGLPVLTRCGQSFASRVASSLLHAVGLPELVTHSPEAYESLAIELALNPQKLTELKAKLDANRLTSPLFNTPLFTKHIESAYQTAHQRHISGLEPEHIHVQH